MFKPAYALSTELVTNIAQVERLYGQIEALRIPKKLELNLLRTNLVTSSYASNKIEGNPLTLPEVTNLLLDDRVPTTRDEKEVVNYYHILMDLNGMQDEKFTVGLTESLHKQLLTGVDESAGQIRNVQVVVGKYKEEKGNVSLRVKHNPPFHKKPEIEKALSELYAWVDIAKELPIVVKAGIFHHEFVRIHPFEDGNGRICRILTALLFIRDGYHINKYFILDDYYDIDREQYSDMLHSADTGDKSQWLIYFSDGVKYALMSALSRAKQAMRTLAYEEQPTPKELEVLKYMEEYPEVTSQDVAKKLGVSRQQSHNLLKSLLEKGLIDKKGRTKSSYYFLK